MAVEDSIEKLIRTLKKQGQESTGAAATEEKRDNTRFQKKQLSLLERIAKAVGAPVKAVKEASPGTKLGLGAVAGGGILATLASTIGGGIKGGMTGLYKGAASIMKSPAILKMMGPMALIAGIALAIKDAFAGWFKAEEWGVSKISGALGGLFGGTGVPGSWKNIGTNALKWGLIGAGLGSFVPVIGTAIGFAVGALIGAVLGWIGGEKIAKWFDAVGTWVAEKWDVIASWPGKIWDAIVNTVKGWLGLGTKPGEDTVPVTVEDDKPKKGWLTAIIDFLIPQWLRDFATDAIGTVTGWLGLTAKDDQGNVTTTAFGKLVFGTIGAIGGFALRIINWFIPQFVKDFVADPLTTVLTWIGIKEEDEETGEVTTTSFGKKVFAKVKKITDWIGSVIKSIIGEGTYNAIIAFASDPLDYVLVNILGWRTKKSEGGEATDKGIEAVKDLEEGNFLNFFSNIVKSIIGEGTYNAIVGFASDPLEYVLVHWLGWKTEEGKATEEGAAAFEKIEKGDIGGFWEQLVRKVIGTGTYDAIVAFVSDPIDYIFVNWLKLGSKGGPPGTGAELKSTGEKAGIIVGTAVGLWESLLKAILPDGVVDFIMSPINWVFGLFGLDKPGDTLATVEEAHGLTVADKESRGGLFGKLLRKILPQGLIDFIMSPINWVLGLFGFGDKPAGFGDETAVTKVDEGLGFEVAEKGQFTSLFDKIIAKVIPQGLIDFMKDPFDYMMTNWFGFDMDETSVEAAVVGPVKEKKSMAESLGKKIHEALGIPSWIADEEDIIDLLKSIGLAKGGHFLGGKPIMVGELGPELILPSAGGSVLNAERTLQMQQAGLRNSVQGMGGGQSVLNNMPVSNISTNQSNTTVTATPLMHPSPIIGMVNSAA